MAGRAFMLGLAVTVLISAIVLYRYYHHEGARFTANMQPANYWCTVVGVEEGTGIGQIKSNLLPPLQSRRLLALRLVRSNSSFAGSLGFALPPFLESVLVALYSEDPHLNWRRAHLLHQGPLSREVVNLAFPTLACQSRLPVIGQTSDELVVGEDTVAVLKPSLSQLDRTAVISMITAANLTILSSWTLTLSDAQIDDLYEAYKGRSFFPSLHQHMCSGPVQVLILRGIDAVSQLRALVGATDPALATPGTIRSTYGINKTANAIHASDSPASVIRELGILCSR